MPATPIPKSMATQSLLSQIITCKYQFGLPLYRKETMLNDTGIDLSRQTMSSWILRSATLLEPLYMRLKTELLAEPAIHSDETPLKVIKAEKQTSYMQVYCCGSDALGSTRILYYSITIIVAEPFVIGRKAWWFSYINTGANASAILYNLVETAKANDFIVHDYIATCSQLIAEKQNDIDALLPWNIKRSQVSLPISCNPPNPHWYWYN